MNIAIIYLIITIIFSFILIFNEYKNIKAIKYSFLIYSIMFLLLIFIFDSNFIYIFFKSIISITVYPNYLTFIIIVLISIFVFILSLLQKNKSKIFKISSYILFSVSFLCYNMLNSLNIDFNLYQDYYEGLGVVIARVEVYTFIVWILINVIMLIIKRGKNE